MLKSLNALLRGSQMILLEYPVRPQPRYGFGKPAHPRLEELIAAGRPAYRRTLEEFLAYQPQLAEIPLQPSRRLPGWRNGFIPGLDAVALYGLLARRRPRRLIEIGSGHSTRFARLAIENHALPTRITSIDPRPRSDIDSISDRVIRCPLEDCDLQIFASLEAGDAIFMDGSHRCFMNSDVTAFFLEVLPSLAPGVLVQIHDVWLPDDYPPHWGPRYYSEQYLLATHLLARGAASRIVLPGHFISQDPELSQVLEPLWEKLGDVERHGCSFWFESGA